MPFAKHLTFGKMLLTIPNTKEATLAGCLFFFYRRNLTRWCFAFFIGFVSFSLLYHAKSATGVSVPSPSSSGRLPKEVVMMSAVSRVKTSAVGISYFFIRSSSLSRLAVGFRTFRIFDKTLDHCNKIAVAKCPCVVEICTDVVAAVDVGTLDKVFYRAVHRVGVG